MNSQNPKQPSPTQANPTPAEQLQDILTRTDRFRDASLARSFATRPGPRRRVMLGDDGCFWIATPADCSRLEGLGYEYAD